jgi:hypothetical protein
MTKKQKQDWAESIAEQITKLERALERREFFKDTLTELDARKNNEMIQLTKDQIGIQKAHLAKLQLELQKTN